MNIKIIVISIVLLGAAAIACWQFLENDGEKIPTIWVEKGNPSQPKPRNMGKESRFANLGDSSVRWQVDVDMLRNLDSDTLDENDIDALYGLLTRTPQAGEEEKWWVVVNEIMEQMRLQAIAPDRYTPEMLSIIRDTTAPEVLRDYAIQHLGQWVTPRGEDLGFPFEQDPDLVKEAAETLAGLVSDPTIAYTSIPGTTLMVLVDMKAGGLPENIINPALETLTPWFAATVIGSTGTGKITRISAINAIGMLHLEIFRPEIRTLATSETTDASLRLNCVATLGQIGDESDLESLQKIATSNSRFRFAAQAAHKKLSSKFQ